MFIFQIFKKELSENLDEDNENEFSLRLERLKLLKQQQKNLFDIVIKQFIYIINEFDNIENENEKKYKLKWINERFEDFLLVVSSYSFSVEIF